MVKKDFLLEIGTEELPPKRLPVLAVALLHGIEQGLSDQGLHYGISKTFAAPRRLGVYISDVDVQQAAQRVERRGPALTVAYGIDGKPTKAALGFAAACGVAVDALQTEKTDRGEWLSYRITTAGKPTIELLEGIVNTAVKRLPIAKPMRWGTHDFAFIRPVHWLLVLFGQTVVPALLFGKQADRLTHGHRFHFPQAIEIKCTQDYETVLQSQAYVIADFTKRKQLIATQVQRLGKQCGGLALYENELLDEVTAMVEYPVVLKAKFDPAFLAVPQEALIAAIQGHQKSFPLIGDDGKLLSRFIFVANIKSQQAQRVIVGNEKVMRARLADAMFFYHTDLKTPLVKRLPKLKGVIFQKKLGDLYVRGERLAALSGAIAIQLGVNVQQAQRAGLLAKCDLVSNMVDEFTQLQGIIGGYYAAHGGEDVNVVKAIKQHYRPEFAGDALPDNPVAQCVALADKLDSLIGMFAIGEGPSGDKDPFGLRRAAIGVLRILIEQQLDIDLVDLIEMASKQYTVLPNKNVSSDVQAYIFERLKHWYLEQEVPIDIFQAVAAKAITNLYDFSQRIVAVQKFIQLPEVKNLSAANKRVHNILRKMNVEGLCDESLLQQTEEQDLYIAIKDKQRVIKSLLKTKDYIAVLTTLVDLQQPVNAFFAHVMVMSDDEKLKMNRLRLLQQLAMLLDSVANIARLS